MSREPVRTAGERIVGFCLGALACAIALTLAVDLIKSIWPWLFVATLVTGLITFYVWRFRRW